MTDTPETDEFFIRIDIDCDLQVQFARKLERERDEAVRSCHIWQTGHAELVAERDYLLNLLQLNQPERKHIGRWGHNRQEFTSPYINNSKQ